MEVKRASVPLIRVCATPSPRPTPTPATAKAVIMVRA
jgi:hypothetical protein